MGCNLRDLASPEKITMADLKGKRVGVDAFLLAFQFLTTIRNVSATGDGRPLTNKDGKIVSHLMGFLGRASAMVSKGIQPVFIFDGEHPEMKAEVMSERRMRTLEAETAWKEAMEVGDFKTAQKMAQRCMRYTPEMVDETMEMLRLMGIPAIRAKAEGEAQGAVMVANGLLDVVATQDWDALLYGAPVLIRNLASDGSKRYGRIIRAEKIVLSEFLSAHEITHEQLVDMGIMIGTDFHPGIPGIGPKTGLKLIKQYSTIERICEEKGKEIPENLDLIRKVFLQHPVHQFEPHELSMKEVDVSGLKQFLEVERDFSPGRVEKAIKDLTADKPVRKDGQTSLFSF